MADEKLIINKLSILRKDRELNSEIYHFPTFEDFIQPGSIKFDHLDWKTITDVLDTIYEKLTSHNLDFATLEGRIPNLSLDSNLNLMYNGSTFLNVDNISLYIPLEFPDFTEDIEGLTNRVTALEANPINPNNFAAANHTHAWDALTGVDESNGYLKLTKGSTNKYVELLTGQKINLRAIASPNTYGNVYVTPQVRQGDKAILIAEPSKDKKFEYWDFNGTPISTNPVHIVDNPSSNGTYIGMFSDAQPSTITTKYYTLQFMSTNTTYGYVKVTVNGNDIISNQTLEEGTYVQVKAIANLGYKFKNWQGLPEGLVTTLAETSFYINLDIRLIADFEEAGYSYIVKVEPLDDNRLLTHVASRQTINTQITVTNGNDIVLQVPETDIAPSLNLCGYEFLYWVSDAEPTYHYDGRIWRGVASANMQSGSPKLKSSGTTNYFAYYKRTFLYNNEPAQTTNQEALPVHATIKINGEVLSLNSLVLPEYTTIQIEAVDIEGYEFVKWSDDNTDKVRSKNIRVNENIWPIYRPINVISYIINVNVLPVSTGVVEGGGAHKQGAQCTLTPHPNDGYRFKEWRENNEILNASDPYVFRVTSDRTLTAVFELDQYTVTAQASTGGTVSPATLTITARNSATVTATPNDGYKFVNWTKNNTLVSTEATYTFTVTENVTLKANFTKKTYTVSALVTPTSGGTVKVNNINNGADVQHGSTATLSATAASGYRFVKWTHNDELVATTATWTTPQITAAISYVAHFEEAAPQDNDTIYYFTSETKDDSSLEDKEAQVAELSTATDKHPINIKARTVTILVPVTIGDISIKDADDNSDITSSFTKDANFEYNLINYIKYYKTRPALMNNVRYCLYK